MRYSLYAVGEIFLVVIGILIALSVNNWNENRKNNSKSTEFYHKLAEELESVRTNLISDQNRAEQVVEYISQSVGILKRGILSESGRDTLDFTFKNFFQFVRMSGELKTFQEMESTGQLGLIYDDELKQKIFDYLTYLESISKIYDQLANTVNETDFVDKFLFLELRPGSIDSKLEYDFNSMAEDPYFINKLARYGYCWQTKELFSGILAKHSEELKEAILLELNGEI